jgi:glyoxylase-like metal-dependent hydrolase (beta-lactamase superfamily II)
MPFSNNIDIIKPSRASNSPTDIVVYDKRTKFLFTGNVVFNDRAIGYAPDSDVSEWLVAINKLKQLKAKHIMGGHGKQYDAKSYETTEKYLLAMKKQIPKLYDEGVGLDEVVKKSNFSNFKYLKHFNELNGKNIYNYYMQVEQQ